jgi:hypothetical protein
MLNGSLSHESFQTGIMNSQHTEGSFGLQNATFLPHSKYVDIRSKLQRGLPSEERGFFLMEN